MKITNKEILLFKRLLNNYENGTGENFKDIDTINLIKKLIAEFYIYENAFEKLEENKPSEYLYFQIMTNPLTEKALIELNKTDWQRLKSKPYIEILIDIAGVAGFILGCCALFKK